MMTAAGTVPAANAFIMGAGVAGLQAIATARRLGGARFRDRCAAGGEGGDQVARRSPSSATRMRRARRRRPPAATPSSFPPSSTPKQAEVVATHIAKQDIVVCTALVQGRKAPTLVTAAMVASMKPG